MAGFQFSASNASNQNSGSSFGGRSNVFNLGPGSSNSAIPKEAIWIAAGLVVVVGIYFLKKKR